jgi:aspartyl-tRNA(Asn)/glutamyl-tRNA(Gln) amidotransferase subunit A
VYNQTTNQELAFLSVDDLTRGYASKQFSPVEVTKACLSRIDAFNTIVNAFCFVDSEGAIKNAKDSENRWFRGEQLSPIDGVPTSTKDTTMVKGWISSFGSRVFGMTTPSEEETSCVTRLREAGAILLGLTNSPEIGWKGVTDSLLHGATRNPWNTDLTPGGSSGGAAVAAALGMGCLHVGTDAGGSIRIPAAFTGVFGYKPSFGRVPLYPSSAFSTLSHAGPLTRRVKDAVQMLNVLTGSDTRDWYSLPQQNIDYSAECQGGIAGLKIAYSPNLGNIKVADEVADEVRKSVDIFETLGATVEECEPDFDDVDKILETFWYGSVASRLHKLSVKQVEMLDPGLQQIFKKSHAVSLVEYMDAAQKRIALGTRANQFHEKFDLLLTPTLPITAFNIGLEIPENSDYEWWPEWAAFCYPFNLTRQPACSIPCGFTAAKLPVGLQIIGRQFDDATVLRAATEFETVYQQKMPVAPISTN